MPPALTVIPGGSSTGSFETSKLRSDEPGWHGAGPAVGPPGPTVISTRPVLSDGLRPADSPVSVWVYVDRPLRELDAEAAALRLPFDLALSLVLERDLTVAELKAVPGGPPAVAFLDKAARIARPTRPLTSYTAAYVAALTAGVPKAARMPPATRGETRAVIPARLLDRIPHAESESLVLDVGSLAEAVGWERAAAFAGHTMTEWALRNLAAAPTHATRPCACPGS